MPFSCRIHEPKEKISWRTNIRLVEKSLLDEEQVKGEFTSQMTELIQSVRTIAIAALSPERERCSSRVESVKLT